MKILFIGLDSDFNKPEGSGIGRYGYELYRFVSNLTVAEKTNFQKGLSPFIYSLFHKYTGYDIIHNIEPKPMVPRSGRTIYITTYHDLRVFNTGLTKSDKTNLRKRLNFETIKLGHYLDFYYSDYIIANSTQTKNELIEKFGNKKKIYVINLGLDKRFLSKTKTPIDHRKFVIGYLGLMGENKNVKFAVKAVNLLKKDFVFKLYGNPEYNYTQIVELANHNKGIQFMGFAPENKLINIYDSFDVFVHPSLYEGFGLPILEAQSRGLPVILYKYGKIPKEVRKYCFEAESPEHMAQIIEDLKKNGYNEKLRKKATEYARSFTWEKCSRETLEVYKNILS